MSVDIGTLVVNVQADTSKLQAELEKIKKSSKDAGDVLKAQFSAMGGALGNFGERVSQSGNALKKIFGDDAPLAFQKLGREIEKSLGLGEDRLKGLSQAAGSLEGVFRLAGSAIGMLANPLGQVVALLVGAYEAIRKVVELNKGAGGLRGTGGGFWSNAAKDFTAGATAIFGSDEDKKQLYSELMSDKQREAAVKRYNELANKGSLGGAEAEEFIGLGNHLPASVLSGGRVKAEGSADLGLGDAVKKFDELLSKWTAKGVTKEDVKAGIDSKKKAEQEAAQLERDVLEYQQMFVDTAEWNAKKKIQDEEDLAEYQQMFIDTAEWNAKQRIQDEEDLADYNQMFIDTATSNLKQMSDRWQSVGGGQFGDALSSTGKAQGVGGAVLNIVGGAAAQYENTGAALQGAAAGGQSGGVWGAIIGAIVELATKTEAFSKIMEGIEELLGGVIDVLGELLKPIANSLNGLFDMIGPLLKVVADVVGMFADLLGAFDIIHRGGKQIFRLVGDLFKMLGTVTDKLSVVGGAMDQKIGGEGGMSVNDVTDWLTLTKVFGGLANLTEGKDFLTGKYKDGLTDEQRAAYWDERWNGDTRRLNEQMRTIQEQQSVAKQREIDEANRAAAALKELADSVYNSAPGYKLAAVMYAAQDRIGGQSAGNPGGF